MGFDADLAAKLAEKAVIAAQNGVKMNTSPNEITQMVLSIFAVGLNAVPVAGGVLAAITTLLGLAIFPAPVADPWTTVAERVDALIGTKLQAHQVKSLRGKMEGLKQNSHAYASVFKSYTEASPDSKQKNADLLRVHYAGFIGVIRAAVPEFQIDDYATVTLPLFAHAANLHLTLLADGIKNGLEWGFPESYVKDTLPDEFNRMTSSGKAARDLAAVESRADNVQLELLREAIDLAETLGVAPELIKLWKEAYGILMKDFATRSKRSTLDYVSHVQKFYTEGRQQVKPYEWSGTRGSHTMEMVTRKAWL